MAGPAHADDQKPALPLVQKVRTALDHGVAYLKRQQSKQGNWEMGTASRVEPGGWTGLVLLALLEAGEPANDPTVARGLAWLRQQRSTGTYAVSLQTIVLARVGQRDDRKLLERNVRWLLDARLRDSEGKLLGWGYGAWPRAADLSNTRFAALALIAAHSAHLAVEADALDSAADLERRLQRSDGGWGYGSFRPQVSAAMTAATTATLFQIDALRAPRQGLQADDTSRHCDMPPGADLLARALAWFESPGHFAIEAGGEYHYYELAEIADLGRWSGRKYLGGHDWYREGCRWLIGRQHEDGAWFERDRGSDGIPVLSTSFAVMFLARGRAPVLVTKLAWGKDRDWNRKPHDLQHLVAQVQAELFPKQSLAWQVLDVRTRDLSAESCYRAELEDLHESPVLFLSGHGMPNLSDVQKRLLRDYLDDGGVLLAEACCGDAGFAEGFRRLMKEMFPEAPLQPVPASHGLWKAHHPLRPADFAIEGLDRGCRTAVFFSPRPLSGWWEEGVDESGGRSAFQLGSNVIAYATGGELPPPRLTRDENARPLPAPRRGTLRIAQLFPPKATPTTPEAMRRIARRLRELGVDADPSVAQLRPGDRELFEYSFLYLCMRERWDGPDDELKTLRAHLTEGAMLVADACGGRAEYDRDFRIFVKRLFPDQALESIPADDLLFSKDINGKPLERVSRRDPESKTGSRLVEGAPTLEGIRIDGRWVVIYSKYALGCPLMHPPAEDRREYHRDSAARLLTATVLYSLKR